MNVSMIGEMNIVKIQKKLKKELDEDRYRHTLGVMYTAAALAMRYEVDLEKAQLAGLLHDCAKCIPNDRKLHLCEKYGLPVTRTEKSSPFLLHAKLGAYIACHKYGVEDQEILDAINWHTTGRADMGMLEKIIFIADYIEPMRWKAENLPLIRKIAFEDIDLAVYLTLRDTLAYLKKGNSSELDSTTEEAFQFYEKLISCRGHSEILAASGAGQV